MARTKKSQASPKLLLPKFIHIENHQKALLIDEGLIRSVVKELFSFLQIEKSSLSIYFVTKKKSGALHREFFNDPTPTDCMSFPMEGDHLGEIVICPAMGLKFPNPLQECVLYLVHGILHLIGYDDLTENDRKVMRSMEKKCLNLLAKKVKSGMDIIHVHG